MRHQHGNHPKVTACVGYIITNLRCAHSCFKSSTSLSSYFSSYWDISNKSWFEHHGVSFFSSGSSGYRILLLKIILLGTLEVLFLCLLNCITDYFKRKPHSFYYTLEFSLFH